MILPFYHFVICNRSRDIVTDFEQLFIVFGFLFSVSSLYYYFPTWKKNQTVLAQK